jgi:hypothetical protein
MVVMLKRTSPCRWKAEVHRAWRAAHLVALTTFLALFASSVPLLGGEPQLRIVGADGDGIKLTRYDPELKHQLEVVATSADSADDARVLVAPFQDVGGSRVSPTTSVWINADGTTPFTGSPRRVTVDTPASFQVSANLPDPGVYTTEISLLHNGKQTFTRLTVTRALRAMDVEAPGVHAAKVVKGWSPTEGLVVMKLRETGNAPRVLAEPTLAHLSIKGSGASMFQRTSSQLTAYQGGRAVKSISLQAGGEVVVDFVVSNIDEPGHYEGSIRFIAPNRQPLEVPFTFVVKEAAWIAALLVTFGVLVSFGIRQYSAMWRKRLVWRRDIRRVRQEIEAYDLTGAQEQAVLRAIQRQLGNLERDVDFDVKIDVDAALRVIDAKLAVFRKWIDAQSEVHKLSSTEQAKPIQEKLGQVARALERHMATLDQIKELEAKVDELGARDVRRNTLHSSLDALVKAVAEEQSRATQALKRDLTERIEPLLSETKALLLADDLEKADLKIAAARMKLSRALAGALRDALSGEPPPGFDRDALIVLKRELEPELDAIVNERQSDSGMDEASKLADVNLRYLRALAEALVKEAGARLVNPPPKTPDQQHHLKRAGALANEAIGAATSRDVSRVVSLYVEARKALSTAEMRVGVREVQVSAGTADSPAAGIDGVVGVVPDPVIPAAARPRETAEQVNVKVRRYDGVVTFIILIIAVGTGVKLLWADDSIWGGLESQMIAVLWGLGLHQVASAPFEGLLGLHDKFTRLSG